MHSNDMGENMPNEYLVNLIKSISDSPPGIAKQETHSDASTKSPSTDVFASLLSNPELLTKIPSIITTVKPILDMLGTHNTSGASPAFSPVISSANEAKETNVTESSAEKQTRKSDDKRVALLCALKPYLSDDRCRAIDYMIKLNRLSDVLKTL